MKGAGVPGEEVGGGGKGCQVPGWMVCVYGEQAAANTLLNGSHEQ